MKRYDYPAILDGSEKGISITFPDLPGCQTFTDANHFVLLMAKDTLARYLQQLKAGDFPIPDPSPVDTIHDSHVVMVTVWV